MVVGVVLVRRLLPCGVWRVCDDDGDGLLVLASHAFAVRREYRLIHGVAVLAGLEGVSEDPARERYIEYIASVVVLIVRLLRRLFGVERGFDVHHCYVVGKQHDLVRIDLVRILVAQVLGGNES